MARSLGESKRNQSSVTDTRKSIVPDPVSKVRQRPLKTMNEISAAEAVKLFHASMHFDDPIDLYAPTPKGFPGDMAARDFLECLKLYEEMWAIGQYDESQDLDDQMVKQTQAAANVSAQDLEKLTPSEKKVFLLWNNERLSYKEIAAELSKSPQTVKAQLASARKTLNPYLTREG